MLNYYNKNIKQTLNNTVTTITPLQEIIIEYQWNQIITKDLLQYIFAHSKFIRDSGDDDKRIRNESQNNPIIAEILKTFNDYINPLSYLYYEFMRLYRRELLEHLPRYILTSDIPMFDLEFISYYDSDQTSIVNNQTSIVNNLDEINGHKVNSIKSEVMFSYRIEFMSGFDRFGKTQSECFNLINTIFLIVLNRFRRLKIDMDNVKFYEIYIRNYSVVDCPIICIDVVIINNKEIVKKTMDK